jgi:hypothetical protein
MTDRLTSQREIETANRLADVRALLMHGGAKSGLVADYALDALTAAVRAETAAELAAVRAESDEARKQMAKVAEFAAKRAEYIDAINSCHNDADYWRWQGQAEARRQLSEELGLPVAWPAESQEASR